MALRTCLRRAAHQLSSRSLLASAAIQTRGLAVAAGAGGDNHGKFGNRTEGLFVRAKWCMDGATILN